MEKLDIICAKIEKRNKRELVRIEEKIDNAFRKNKIKKAIKLIVKHNSIMIRQEIDLEVLIKLFKEAKGELL